MAETKYAGHVITLPFHQGKKGPLFGVGAKEMNGLNVNVIYACAYETGITGLSTKPHLHDYDEAVFFIGTDPHHLDDLGAEVEMSIGEEEEKHVFDKPTVVVLPRGLPHCPIVTRRLDRPYVCMAVSLTGQRDD